MRARLLMDRHGLSAWQFSFSNKKTIYGECFYDNQHIQLSRHYVMSVDVSEAMIDDVILHEIAHALAGHAAGHGPEWKAVARNIGCSAERCSPVMVKTPGEFVITCPCKAVRIRRFRWSAKMSKSMCRHCHGRLLKTSVVAVE